MSNPTDPRDPATDPSVPHVDADHATDPAAVPDPGSATSATSASPGRSTAAPEGVLAYRRHVDGPSSGGGADHIVVAINFTEAPARVDITGDVLLSTRATCGEAVGLELGADEAVILRASR